MTKVVLINQEKIPHYRIPIYNYLSAYLQREMYALTIVSEGAQEGNTHQIEFDHKEISLSFLSLARLLLELDPDVIIYWVHLRNLYLFPTLLLIKILKKKSVYWGHGTDLAGKGAIGLKNFLHGIEYWLSDALILYANHLKINVKAIFHDKTFIANSTLNFNNYQSHPLDKSTYLSKYGIATPKNIICMGRMQRRKRLEDLFRAFDLLNRRDFGLIMVGPDSDGILRGVHGDNIYKLNPIYGDERLDLLSAADVFCLPGAVGLSIVDAFYCGLPIVTEDGDASPEIMYLKDGINGFIVPRGDVYQLASRVQLLLDDDVLRKRFSREARREINTNGHIDKMCQGFSNALGFVCKTGLVKS
jgi:glycosyltransferase involved in cell wall biosynthesis